MKKFWAVLAPVVAALVFIPTLAEAASGNFNSAIGIGSASPIVSLDMSQEQDALALPVGTSGARPTGGAATSGEIRYNSTTSAVEAYEGGLWTALGGVASGDAFWNNVVFMPRATSGNTGTDLSGNALALTLTNITTSSSTTQQDAYSWASGGSTASINFTTNVSAGYYGGDFTVEFWYYQTSGTPTGQEMFQNAVASGLNIEMKAGTASTPMIHQDSVGDLITSAGGNTSLNTWHHLAAVRQGSMLYLWIDGALQGTTATTTTFPNGIACIFCGTSPGLVGNIAGFRITKYARYLTPFTPPTTPFPTTMLGGP